MAHIGMDSPLYTPISPLYNDFMQNVSAMILFLLNIFGYEVTEAFLFNHNNKIKIAIFVSPQKMSQKSSIF